MGPIICNVFIGDLGPKNSSVLMKSTDDKKQGAVINTEENQNIIQEELDDLEDWSNRNRRIRCRSARIRCRSARSLTWGLTRRRNAINWKCNSYT